MDPSELLAFITAAKEESEGIFNTAKEKSSAKFEQVADLIRMQIAAKNAPQRAENGPTGESSRKRQREPETGAKVVDEPSTKRQKPEVSTKAPDEVSRPNQRPDSDVGKSNPPPEPATKEPTEPVVSKAKAIPKSRSKTRNTGLPPKFGPLPELKNLPPDEAEKGEKEANDEGAEKKASDEEEDEDSDSDDEDSKKGEKKKRKRRRKARDMQLCMSVDSPEEVDIEKAKVRKFILDRHDAVLDRPWTECYSERKRARLVTSVMNDFVAKRKLPWTRENTELVLSTIAGDKAKNDEAARRRYLKKHGITLKGRHPSGTSQQMIDKLEKDLALQRAKAAIERKKEKRKGKNTEAKAGSEIAKVDKSGGEGEAADSGTGLVGNGEEDGGRIEGEDLPHPEDSEIGMVGTDMKESGGLVQHVGGDDGGKKFNEDGDPLVKVWVGRRAKEFFVPFYTFDSDDDYRAWINEVIPDFNENAFFLKCLPIGNTEMEPKNAGYINELEEPMEEWSESGIRIFLEKIANSQDDDLEETPFSSPVPCIKQQSKEIKGCKPGQTVADPKMAPEKQTLLQQTNANQPGPRNTDSKRKPEKQKAEDVPKRPGVDASTKSNGTMPKDTIDGKPIHVSKRTHVDPPGDSNPPRATGNPKTNVPKQAQPAAIPPIKSTVTSKEQNPGKTGSTAKPPKPAEVPKPARTDPPTKKSGKTGSTTKPPEPAEVPQSARAEPPIDAKQLLRTPTRRHHPSLLISPAREQPLVQGGNTKPSHPLTSVTSAADLEDADRQHQHNKIPAPSVSLQSGPRARQPTDVGKVAPLDSIRNALQPQGRNERMAANPNDLQQPQGRGGPPGAPILHAQPSREEPKRDQGILRPPREIPTRPQPATMTRLPEEMPRPQQPRPAENYQQGPRPPQAQAQGRPVYGQTSPGLLRNGQRPNAVSPGAARVYNPHARQTGRVIGGILPYRSRLRASDPPSSPTPGPRLPPARAPAQPPVFPKTYKDLQLPPQPNYDRSSQDPKAWDKVEGGYHRSTPINKMKNAIGINHVDQNAPSDVAVKPTHAMRPVRKKTPSFLKQQNDSQEADAANKKQAVLDRKISLSQRSEGRADLAEKEKNAYIQHKAAGGRGY